MKIALQIQMSNTDKAIHWAMRDLNNKFCELVKHDPVWSEIRINLKQYIVPTRMLRVVKVSI